MMDLMSGWRFGLPSSLGRRSVFSRARQFAYLLDRAGFTSVVPVPSYARLEEVLTQGEVDAAWGPPLVCARAEAAGGRVALRGLRHGAASYRSVLVCRSEDRFDLKNPGKLRRRPRAVWVDERSMAGYILPRAYLRSLQLDLTTLFVGEKFVGSFETAVREVLEGDADITATFASSASATRTSDGFVEISGYRAVELRVLGYTNECPNDGIVLSPKLPPAEVRSLVGAVRALVASSSGSKDLAELFEVEGFDEPPSGTYTPLLDLT